MVNSSSVFRMPAEWEPHQATWMSWPHNERTWPGCLEEAQAALTQAVIALAPGEEVHINVLDAAHGAVVMQRFAGQIPAGRVHVHTISTDDAWCRDHGAIVAFDANDQRVALQFRFNAWGGKYPHAADARVAAQMAAVLGLGTVAVDLVLEGGSIEVNGAGAVLTTEQCLLNPNRNPQLSRAAIEASLRAHLGVTEVLWLGDGIVGDDTDGHVDDLTRFVGRATVLTVVESDPQDANFDALRDNLQRLRRMSLADGTPLSVIEMPMPTAVIGKAGRLPASYANFYVGNEVVLAPVFDCPRDADAIDALTYCYPTRRIVPIDCRALVVGLGTLHCLTQQIPAPLPARAC